MYYPISYNSVAVYHLSDRSDNAVNVSMNNNCCVVYCPRLYYVCTELE